MYEFTDKEIRKKFKKTQYGKKTNKLLYISLSIALVATVVCGLIIGFKTGFNVDLKESSEILLIALKALTFVTIIIACYFDGKRDGAIEQFKKTTKNKD